MSGVFPDFPATYEFRPYDPDPPGPRYLIPQPMVPVPMMTYHCVITHSQPRRHSYPHFDHPPPYPAIYLHRQPQPQPQPRPRPRPRSPSPTPSPSPSPSPPPPRLQRRFRPEPVPQARQRPRRQSGPVFSQEHNILPSPPDAGRLFGQGSPGSPAHFNGSREDRELRDERLEERGILAQGPYTSMQTPKGPTPAPVFTNYREGTDALRHLPYHEPFGRGIKPRPHVDNRPHPALVNPPKPPKPRPRAKSLAERREEAAEIIEHSLAYVPPGSRPLMRTVTLDDDYPREQQIWQEPEQAGTMFGLHRHLILPNWNGVVTKYPLGPVGLYWRVNREPRGNSFAWDLERKRILLPLGELAFEPPRRNITLGVIRVPDQQCAVFPLEIVGGQAGITIGDVLRALYESNNTLQDICCAGLIHGTFCPQYRHKGKLHDWVAVLVQHVPARRKSALPH